MIGRSNGYRVSITGLGASVPERVVTNDELASILDTSDEWIVERTGIRERRVARDDEALSDVCLPAVRDALAGAGLAGSDLDLVIVATVTPDMAFPATAALLADELGASRAGAFDLSAGCTGFVYAVAQAYAMLASGLCSRALVVGGDLLSKVVDWSDRATCVLFGDGAGAVVLRRSHTPGILSSHLHADGSLAGMLSVPGTVCGGKVSGRPLLQMDGGGVFKFAVKVLDDIVGEALAANKLQKADIDWLIPHQANIRIIQATAKKLGLSMEKVVITVDRHANTSAASIPLALDEAVRDGRIRPGQHVLLEGVGGGFTWGAVLVRW